MALTRGANGQHHDTDGSGLLEAPAADDPYGLAVRDGVRRPADPAEVEVEVEVDGGRGDGVPALAPDDLCLAR
ncbi:hypothetical protein [Streptomyces sp. TRM49041]|uniref:hypothetical protein n=1 Tax=Streptomyces sp. TRM49041 TaxID=2603216 RepID=UPI0011EC41A4|nr:hypothetical protein [Streptomyces sp. TRM49041]